MFLLVPAYPGCPGSKAVKRSLLFNDSGGVSNCLAILDMYRGSTPLLHTVMTVQWLTEKQLQAEQGYLCR